MFNPFRKKKTFVKRDPFYGYEVGEAFGQNAGRFAIYDNDDNIVKTYSRKRDAVRGLERMIATAEQIIVAR